MAGLVPAIHVFLAATFVKSVDARDKPGHDEFRDSSDSNGLHFELRLSG